jgi:AcrR family transcriptional regulator
MQTRARLVDAGRRLIGARGLDGVAIATIAEEADVAVGSFYNYFGSKQDLLDVIIAEVAALLDEVLERLTSPMSDPAERVAACVRSVVHLAGEDPTWAWFVLRASDAVPRLAASVTVPIERHVRAGIAIGRFEVEDPTLALNAVGGAMLQVMRATLLGELGPWADRLAAEHVLRLLGVAPAAAHVVASRRLPVIVPHDARHGNLPTVR